MPDDRRLLGWRSRIVGGKSARSVLAFSFLSGWQRSLILYNRTQAKGLHYCCRLGPAWCEACS